ncbi:transcriptional repressor [Ophiocordyceps camponoti-floridani]|uniref:Transcriptional repressor n=1 Tax=Ophiocordyceps camponoti-floridani TaxID=2030778 RepID=A0A8H4Q1U9_9HYPO|nr:transcriptional repressor [Ophiocordyceps camponoti-floridani]
MQSTDDDHFFQTDAAQVRKQKKSAKAGNKNGKPLDFKSKILAAIPDPSCPRNSVFIGQSSGCVRRVRVDDAGLPQTAYRGPNAPVTCLAVGGNKNQTLFAGSWDKDIWSWDVASGRPGRKYSGHGDFVKTVVCARLAGRELLMSGGADRKIMVWDVDTGRRLYSIQDAATTMLAVQHVAIDPVLSTEDALVLVSASSDPHIRRWELFSDGYKQLPQETPDRITIHEHDTSVYRLVFDTEGDDVDLWTASADGTVKCLARNQGFATDEALAHGDFVRAVVVTPRWVVSAGRDENVKVWERARGKLRCTLEGHLEEVTDLVVLRDDQGTAETVCSVSIDGTMRQWSLDETELVDVIGTAETAETGEAGTGLTAEEEAELAELMDDQ